MIEDENEAISMIFYGIPGITVLDSQFFRFLVQRNGKQGEFDSALEAINFYNSTFNE
jgi:hypothetical protein